MKADRQRRLRDERPKRDTDRAAPSRQPAMAPDPGGAFDGIGNRAIAALLRSGHLQRKSRAATPHNPPADENRRASDVGRLLGRLDSGRELDQNTRGEMESHFGQSFRDVRIHTGQGAADAAEMIQARAFTASNEIVFGDGEFAPETREGQRLLAHELAHVAQQRRPEGQTSAGTAKAKLTLSEAGDPLEREADAAAERVVQGSNPILTIPGGRAMPAILRQVHDQPAIQRQPTAATQRDDDTSAGAPAKAGFGNQRHVAGRPGFGNRPHAVGPDGAAGVDLPPAPQLTIPDIRSEQADNIERFQRIWLTGGQAALESEVYGLLKSLAGYSDVDSVDLFAASFGFYISLQIAGRTTDEPTVQMLVGIAATVLAQQKRIKAEIEARNKFLAVFEETARKHVMDALMTSEKRMYGELKQYGFTWPTDPSSAATWAQDGIATRRALGIAAAGLERRRNAVIKANAAYRNMVRDWGHRSPQSEIKPVEDAKRQADRDFEIFRLQVIQRFPVLEEISAPEIHPFDDEDAEPDDPQVEQLNKLAQMAQGGSSKEATDFIVETVFEKLHNIEKVRKELEPRGDLNIWRVPEIVQGTRELTGAASGTLNGEWVEQKYNQENQPPNESESLLSKILFYGGMVLAPLTGFLSLVPHGIYLAGKTGYDIDEHYQKYKLQKALHGTDFGAAAISAEDPSLFWLAGDILHAAFAMVELAPMAGPAARVFGRLAPFARLAREVQAGEEALSALTRAAETVAREELLLDAKAAGEFATKVGADAQAARSGGMGGMTADEAKMLEQVKPAVAELNATADVTSATLKAVAPEPRAILPSGRSIPHDSYSGGYYGTSEVPPEIATKSGIPLRGNNWDLQNHSEQLWRNAGPHAVNDSAFRGTTNMVSDPANQGGAAYWAEEGGWVYEIRGVPTWDVNKALQGQVGEVGSFRGNLMHGEGEYAIPAHVPADKIVRWGVVKSDSRGRLYVEWTTPK